MHPNALARIAAVFTTIAKALRKTARRCRLCQMRSSVSYCAEQAKRAAKTFDIATDCDTHESVEHLLITF